MIARLKTLNPEMQAQSEEPWPGEVSIGIGLNSGPCCVGNMGSSQRLSYSLIGDTVNLASRIEGLTKQYGVQLAIGSALAEKLPGFAMLELDLVRVVGRDQPETIYVLLGDENLAEDTDFKTHAEKHQSMIAAYRKQDWTGASTLIAELSGTASTFDLEKLYTIYAERIESFRKDPPEENWDGVYEATSK